MRFGLCFIITFLFVVDYHLSNQGTLCSVRVLLNYRRLHLIAKHGFLVCFGCITDEFSRGMVHFFGRDAVEPNYP